MTKPLSPAMEQALRNGARDDFAGIFECSRSTERALIQRGLAEAVIGTASRRNYAGLYKQTVYNAYLGIRFTPEGREVAACLIAREG